MLLHIDGARLSNAAAALEVPLRALTTEAGVDVVSFGGTKNGLLGAEAVVFRDRSAAEVEYVRKQSLQLASKMRFFAAQFEALLTDELWRRCALHADAMAERLAASLKHVRGLTITRPVHCNAVFATVPAKARLELQEEFAFYVWDESTGEVRWMCSWDTTGEDVERSPMRSARCCLSLLAALALRGTDRGKPPQRPASLRPHVGVRDRRRRSHGQLGAYAGYDLVVLDGQEASARQVRALRAAGKVVLAYLDVGTIERGRPWFAAARPYRLNYWPDWGEWYANVSAPGFRRLMANRVAPSMLRKGFSGLFLDNTDMIETHARQTRGMRVLVRSLAHLVHSGHRFLFAQNGEDSIGPLLPYYDGWNREDVSATYDFSRHRYIRQGAGEVARRPRASPDRTLRTADPRHRLHAGGRRGRGAGRDRQRVLGRRAAVRQRHRPDARAGASAALLLVGPRVPPGPAPGRSPAPRRTAARSARGHGSCRRGARGRQRRPGASSPGASRAFVAAPQSSAAYSIPCRGSVGSRGDGAAKVRVGQAEPLGEVRVRSSARP